MPGATKLLPHGNPLTTAGAIPLIVNSAQQQNIGMAHPKPIGTKLAVPQGQVFSPQPQFIGTQGHLFGNQGQTIGTQGQLVSPQ